MATWRVDNSDGRTFWQASHTYEVGDRCIVSPTAATGERKYIYRCTVGGESGESEPAWDTSGTFVDNEVTWTTERPNDGTWENATPSLRYLLHTAISDTILVHNEHNETVDYNDGTHTLYGATGNNLNIICVDKDTEEPSVGASILFEADVTSVRFNGNVVYSFGISWRIEGPEVYFIGSTSRWIFDGNGGQILYLPNEAIISVYDTYGFAIFKNGSIRLGNYLTYLDLDQDTSMSLENVSIVADNGTKNLFKGSYFSGAFTARGCDFSQCGHGAEARSLCDADTKSLNDPFIIARNCKLPDQSTNTGFTIIIGGESITEFPGTTVELSQCASNGGPHRFLVRSEGTEGAELDYYRSSGAVLSGTHYSVRLSSTSITDYPGVPLKGSQISKYVTTVSEVTLTIEGIIDSADTLTDAEVSAEFAYPGSGGRGCNALYSTVCLPNVTPSNLTTSSETWANSGNMSNPQKFKISATVTLVREGIVSVRVSLWRPDASIYIDPVITIS